ncbi:Clp protease N-terminal domain-containing protein [Gemmatimonas sp.]|uniref:Clp protease N-terminal domain-containing protein n=1 Tax=Gemmatimonas sp. TaxID=1962908 RepID=UPI00286E2E2D|nr:Clp protease N-terminal domain-containing protein [Gemmatimonas sp.]
MSIPRSLPLRPNLEFERKEAKALLRLLRAGDGDARSRAQARLSAVQVGALDTLQLADAQLVIAREYGFASWPRLVRYFEEAERLLHRTPSAVNPGLYRPEEWPGMVQDLIARHGNRRVSAARSLVSYVPRFYGMSLEDAFDIAPTEDEARLAVARGNGFPSWDALMARVHSQATREGLEVPPLRRAYEAMTAADLSQLQAIAEAHPELRTPTEHEIATCRHLLRMALDRERMDVEQGADRHRMRAIIEWLASIGFDVQRELNLRLCGDMRITAEDVHYWIDRGADPNWVAPNGYSVLEHAVVRYRSPGALDRLAQYATVRQPALWIAAGLGDVAGVGRFLDASGRPTDAARENRPQFDAIGPHVFGRIPGDDNDEILAEAAMIAFLNGRTAVMEYLVARGFPVNTRRWDMPFVVMAVGNNKVEMVEALIRSGADLDLRGACNGSAREMAREMLESQPPDADRHRIAELCGLDIDAILAARDARPPSSPKIMPQLTRMFGLASDDARRLEQVTVNPEHLLFGMLRGGYPAVRAIVDESGMDRERFRVDVGDRVRHGEHVVDGAPLPFAPDAQAALDAAIHMAAEQRREVVHPNHVLLALVQRGGVVADSIVRYGGSVDKVTAYLTGLR